MRRATLPIVVAMALVSVAFAAAGPTAAGVASPVHGADAGCGTGLVVVAGGLCTHGGDRVPPTVEGAATRAATAARSEPSELCAGNGKNGRRIRVFYGYPSDTVSRATTFRTWVRDSVAMADANLDAQTPGIDGQHLRMYCKNGRRVTVSSIELLPIGDTAFTFTDMIGSLEDRVTHGLGDADFDAPRFTYVVFADNVTCCYGPGGQGTIYWDDRGDPAVNLNNQAVYGPRFAMVKIAGSISSGAYIFLHEVGHTLGAVQHLGAAHVGRRALLRGRRRDVLPRRRAVVRRRRDGGYLRPDARWPAPVRLRWRRLLRAGSRPGQLPRRSLEHRRQRLADEARLTRSPATRGHVSPCVRARFPCQTALPRNVNGGHRWSSATTSS